MPTLSLLFAPKRRVPRARSRGFRPRVESLEDRSCPSGGVMEWSDPFGSGATAIAVQPDGKTVVVGEVLRKTAGDVSIFVQRLNRDGALDTTFNKTGSLTIQTGIFDFPKTVALQPDGKILIGGGAQTSNGTAESLVARVNSNGTLDTTFGNSRGLELLTNAGQVKGLAVLTDPTHPSAVTGIVAAALAPSDAVGASFGVYKLTPAGVPDKAFGSSGLATLSGLTGGQVTSVAVAPSGEIYLAGYTNFGGMIQEDGCLAAVTPAGALDRTFGGGAGYVLVDPTGSQESEFNDLAVQTLTVNGHPVSRLVAVGYIAAPNSTGFVAAYTLSGTLDSTFGTGGSFTCSNPPGLYSWTEFQSLALEGDGSIVVGGGQNYAPTTGTIPEMLIGHLTADGAADTSFGADGTGFVAMQIGRSSEVWGLAIDPTNGDIMICGYTQPPSGARQDFVARFTAPV